MSGWVHEACNQGFSTPAKLEAHERECVGLRQDGVPRTAPLRQLRSLLVDIEGMLEGLNAGGSEATIYNPRRRITYHSFPLQERIRSALAEASQLPASDALDRAISATATAWQAQGRLHMTFHGPPPGEDEPSDIEQFVADIIARARAGEPSEPGGGAGE